MNGNPCTPAPADPCKTDPSGMDANGQPCMPAPVDPCEANPNGMNANGEPCTPAPVDPCETNPNGPDMNGQPCTPAPVDPCEANPAGNDMNGQPCTPAPNVVERQEIGPEPVHTVIVEPSEPPRTLAAKAPQGAVLGAVGTIRASRERVLANASLAAPRRCITRPYSAVLRGRGIRRVTMYVNGRKVRTMAGGRSSYALRVLPSQARGGVIRVAARVEYVAASGRRAQTLRMTALRCSGGAAPVRFAG